MTSSRASPARTSSASAAATSSATGWSSASSRPTTRTTRPRRPTCAAPQSASGPRPSMALEVEVLDAELAAGRPDLPEEADIARLVSLAVATAGVRDGHVAIAFVDEQRIAELNAQWRGKQGPTDVLSFPIDEAQVDVIGPREL